MKMFLLFTLIWLNSGFGQVFSTRIEPANLEIGEPFEVVLELPISILKPKTTIKFKSGQDLKKMRWTALRPNIKKDRPDTILLDVINTANDTLTTIQGNTFYQIKMKLMCLDTGVFLFSPDSIAIDKKYFLVDAAVFKVSLVQVVEQSDILDIKENFAKLPTTHAFITFLKKYWWLILILLSAIGALIYFSRKEKKQPVETAISLSSKDLAIKKLQDLIEQRIWESQGLTFHFTQAVSILKSYLGIEFQTSFDEKTTLEIKLLCQQKKISSLLQREVAVVLEVSDLVKFAQSGIEDAGIVAVNQRMIEFIQLFEFPAR